MAPQEQFATLQVLMAENDDFGEYNTYHTTKPVDFETELLHVKGILSEEGFPDFDITNDDRGYTNNDILPSSEDIMHKNSQDPWMGSDVPLAHEGSIRNIRKHSAPNDDDDKKEKEEEKDDYTCRKVIKRHCEEHRKSSFDDADLINKITGSIAATATSQCKKKDSKEGNSGPKPKLTSQARQATNHGIVHRGPQSQLRSIMLSTCEEVFPAHWHEQLRMICLNSRFKTLTVDAILSKIEIEIKEEQSREIVKLMKNAAVRIHRLFHLARIEEKLESSVMAMVAQHPGKNLKTKVETRHRTKRNQYRAGLSCVEALLLAQFQQYPTLLQADCTYNSPADCDQIKICLKKIEDHNRHKSFARKVLHWLLDFIGASDKSVDMHSTEKKTEKT